MGMYTAFHFAANLENPPESVLNIIKYMTAKECFNEEVESLDHPFFKCERWYNLFLGNSAYFNYQTECSFVDLGFKEGNHFGLDPSQDWYLSVTSNIKNYDSEIENFIDWIHPYLTAAEDEMLGYMRYEEDIKPCIFYYTKEYIKIERCI